ncbi:MAG: hypothetical protein ACE5FP_01755 [Gemmatimonadota bacterium]
MSTTNTDTITSVELVYFSGCPNVDEARANLRSALQQPGREPEWREWNIDDAETPDRVRGFASPAVLIDGEHVRGDGRADGGIPACSIAGAPTPAEIVGAIGT